MRCPGLYADFRDSPDVLSHLAEIGVHICSEITRGAVAFAYFTARMGNLVYNQSTLQGHGFESTLQAGELAMIYLTNWLMIAFTLGLAMPWAKVRLANYRAKHLVVIVDGSLDNFVAAEEQNVGSLGEEIGEAFDMDIGL